jgi:hypothetical protein
MLPSGLVAAATTLPKSSPMKNDLVACSNLPTQAGGREKGTIPESSSVIRDTSSSCCRSRLMTPRT